MIVWGGVTSRALNLTVEQYPDRPRPAKKYSVVSVPGRNGALHIDTGAYNNYTQPYEIGIRASEKGLSRTARDIAQWLYTPNGYCRLEDSYEPDVYRMAYFSGPQDIENILNQLGRATIEFSCKPQRFLKSGEIAVKVPSRENINNPTAFKALPLITIVGSGQGRLQIGEYVVEIQSLDGNLILDCDLQNAYYGTTNLNSTISAPDFPVLIPGDNKITYTGDWEVEIVPRWWTL